MKASKREHFSREEKRVSVGVQTEIMLTTLNIFIGRAGHQVFCLGSFSHVDVYVQE